MKSQCKKYLRHRPVCFPGINENGQFWAGTKLFKKGNSEDRDYLRLR